MPKVGKIVSGATLPFRKSANGLDLSAVFGELDKLATDGKFTTVFELDEDERDEASVTSLKNQIRNQVRRHGLMAEKPYSVNVIFGSSDEGDAELEVGIRKITLREPRGPHKSKDDTTAGAAPAPAATPADAPAPAPAKAAPLKAASGRR